MLIHGAFHNQTHVGLSCVSLVLTLAVKEMLYLRIQTIIPHDHIFVNIFTVTGKASQIYNKILQIIYLLLKDQTNHYEKNVQLYDCKKMRSSFFGDICK